MKSVPDNYRQSVDLLILGILVAAGGANRADDLSDV